MDVLIKIILFVLAAIQAVVFVGGMLLVIATTFNINTFFKKDGVSWCVGFMQKHFGFVAFYGARTHWLIVVAGIGKYITIKLFSRKQEHYLLIPVGYE